MKVLVIGASGETGRYIVEYMTTKTEYHPYVMICDENKSKQLMELGAVEVIVKNLEDPIDEDITNGMDAVIFAAGSNPETEEDKAVTIDQEGAKKLIDSAKKAGVQHFVMLSAMGTDDPQGPYEDYLEAKRVADDYLQNSGVPFTIIRPGELSNDPGTGKIEIDESLAVTDHITIPREDAAQVLVESLRIKNVKNKVFEVLSGDKDINQALEML